MTTCALPGCDQPARSTRPGSCCCPAHQRKLYKQTHKAELRAHENEYRRTHKKPLKMILKGCKCGCGMPFLCSVNSRRLYIDQTHGARDRSRRADDKAERHARYKARYVPTPREPKPEAHPKPRKSIACKVDRPARAQTHTRLKPKSHNATALDERMDKVVRDAWQNGDKYQRAQIEALNKNMVFA